jgi:hypothetical protein
LGLPQPILTIPTGLRHLAQGCEERATLGKSNKESEPCRGFYRACKPFEIQPSNKSMKNKIRIALMVLCLLCALQARIILAQNIETMAPVVVKTVPQAGATDVAPGEMEVKITFSKDMMDNSWSMSSAWKDSEPEYVGKPKYQPDHRTLVVKVKLESGKTYGWWINSQRFTGFKDAQGHTAIPYFFAFKVR